MKATAFHCDQAPPIASLRIRLPTLGQHADERYLARQPINAVIDSAGSLSAVPSHTAELFASALCGCDLVPAQQ